MERARVLVILVDLAAVDGVAPQEQERILLDELGRYRAELLERPRVVVGSKADIAGDIASDVAAGDAGTGAELTELQISAVTGQGIDALLGRLAHLVVDARAAETGAVDRRWSCTGPCPRASRWCVEDDGSFEVLGRAALRAVALSDLTDDQAVAYVQERLRRLGVERALVRAGARDGDVVHLGKLTFTYQSDAGGLDAAAAAVGGTTRRGPHRGNVRAGTTGGRNRGRGDRHPRSTGHDRHPGQRRTRRRPDRGGQDRIVIGHGRRRRCRRRRHREAERRHRRRCGPPGTASSSSARAPSPRGGRR